jgi:Legionella pneumophila major outer membrane protein precursor/Porin subfamily
MRVIASILFAVTALLATIPAAKAQPLEYLRICRDYPTHYFYIPGTETCVNASTGTTFVETEFGLYKGRTALREQIDRALEAIAMTAAMPTARIENGHNFALAGDWGYFEGYNALGLSLAVRLEKGFQLALSGAYGLEEGQIGTSLSLNYSFNNIVPAFRGVKTGRATYGGPPPDSFEARWIATVEGGLMHSDSPAFEDFLREVDPLDSFYQSPDSADGVFLGASLERDVNEDVAWRLSARRTVFESEGTMADATTFDTILKISPRLRMTNVDMDALYALDADKRFRLLAGVRGFSSEDNIKTQSFPFNHWSTSGTIATGIGPRIGVDALVPAASRFAFVGRASVSALFANFDSRFGNLHNTINHFWSDDWIYALDARAAVKFSVSESLDLTAGYRVEHWMDLRRSFDMDTGEIHSDDVTQHGPFVALSMTF